MKTLAIVIALFALGALAGCHEGNLGIVPVSDMSKPIVHDLEMPDLAKATCGATVLCVIQSGTTNPLGAVQCFQGASPMAQQQAGALLLCAGQHCIAGDGGAGGGLGGGNQLQLLQCLNTNCQMQLSGCQGLGL